MDYFKVTPMRKWTKEKAILYLNKKGITVDLSVVASGHYLATVKLTTLRKTLACAIADKVFLIIHERLEREEEVNQRKPALRNNYGESPVSTGSGRSSNSMSELDIGPPAISSSQSSPSSYSVNILPPPHLSICDFDQTDERASAYLEQTKKTTAKYGQIITTIKCKNFIEQFPPILWQQRHLQYYLDTKGLAHTDVDVNDFIFMSADELETLYPTKGVALYESIRSRFVNPTIVKLPKITTCKVLD